MTATADTDTQTTTGRVVRVTGPVVDVEFPRNQVPPLYTALHVDVTFGDLANTRPREIPQHLADTVTRAISLRPPGGLVRGQPVTSLGRPISVPVGEQVKGH